MPANAPPDIAQHNREIQQNALRWAKKPLLRRIYGQFYAEIAQRVQHEHPGLIVEIGSGIGNLKQAIPGCITTDLFDNPWLDQVENAYALTFKDNTVANLVLFDVWHHLEYPGSALREFRRVLVPGGRLILLEPAMGWLGRIIYGLFHHEPLGWKEIITWEAPAGLALGDYSYFAAQSRAWRIFFAGERAPALDGWNQEELKTWSSLDYLASGGFSGPQVYPTAAWPLVRALDRLLSRAPRLFASRMLVVLSKRS